MHSYFPSFSDEIPAFIAPFIIGWARVPPANGWMHPGAVKEWSPILCFDPDEPNRPGLEGWLWLFENGRVREVYARPYEVVQGQERPG
jgi:hypothetical protein